MNFFRYFPKTMDIEGRVITNLSKRVIPKSGTLTRATLYYKYKLKDGERLDTLAKRIYGSEEYQWVIMAINQMMDPREACPLTQRELNEYLIQKYGSVETSMTEIRHYVDPDGVIVNDDAAGARGVTYYEYEDELNESKRAIKLVRPEFISAFKDELRRVLS